MQHQSNPRPCYLSVVFSFRNEQEVLSELIRRTRDVLVIEMKRGVLNGFEMVFVNDASTDGSQGILLDELHLHADIRIINMSRCFGVAPCAMAGLEHARGDAVIYMDADLQDPPEVIPSLLEASRKDGGADVVHTVRRSRKGESSVKLWVTKLGYFILNKSSNVLIPQEAGDFKLLSRRAVNQLVQLKEHRPFVRGLVSWVGFRQVFVEYDREARFAGNTKFPVFGWKVIENFLGSALISFSSAPLRIAMALGLVAIVFDLLLVVHVFLEKIQGRAIPGWAAIMITVLFMGGVQLFCIGIMGIYINAIHEQSRNRPNYIVESTHGFPQSSTQQSPSKQNVSTPSKMEVSL